MIKQNLIGLKERISAICLKTKQDYSLITIVAVCKNRSPEEIKEVIAAGIIDIAENKVQEVLKKYRELELTEQGLRKINWHMVGHLQTNKVKEAVRIFDLIQSVDSLRLAKEIDKEALKINKVQDILIEVKTSPEATKFGLKPEELTEAIKEIANLKNINIQGLMTIAPVVDEPEKTRPYFRMLRELKDRINALGIANCRLRILSMGMTDDFEVAVEEGANMVRIGKAIFEG